MKKLVFAEKPDIGTRLAATLGGVVINGTPLTPDKLNDRSFEPQIKRERATKGYFDCGEYIITWGFGHLAELKQAADYDSRYQKWSLELFPFIPKQYEIKPRKNVDKQLGILRKLFHDPEVSIIINATDADREGELIFDYVYDLLNCKKPVKRLWISSYTEEAIEKGFKNLRDPDKNLQQAGRARAIADWLVGANLTSVATLQFGGFKNMISVGRVQTPTLSLLVNRENEIKNFKSEDYYEVEAEFQAANGSYIGKWQGERIKDKQKAEALRDKLKGAPGEVVLFEEETSKERSPLLYDLTSLQMEANSRYGLTAQDTLDAAQKLYESQLITYPRTNSRYLSDDLKAEMPRILRAVPDTFANEVKTILSKPLSFSKRYFDQSKIESHHAIIPTYKRAGALSGNEAKVYDLIVRRTLQAFMPAAVWASRKIETQVKGEVFASSGKKLIEAGWRSIELSEPKKEPELPKVKKGERVIQKKISILSKKTKAPSRYTERSLLAAMETAGKLVEEDELREAMKERGLGTPATRAPIIERLIAVGYVQRNKKTLLPTDKGIELIRILPVEEVKSPAMTGEWEYRLNQIEKGQESGSAFLKDIEAFTRETVNSLKKASKQEIVADALGTCPKCGSPVVANKKGWGCAAWRSGCKFQLWNSPICGKKLTKANVKQLLTKGETNLIKGFTSKAGKKFDARLKLEEDGRLSFKF